MNRRTIVRAALAAFLTCTGVRVAAAQGVTGGRPRAARQPIEQLATLVQRRLRLTDEQAGRLRQTTGRFAAQRQTLMARERDTRRALRAQTAAGDSADQNTIARAIDDLLRLQQQRVQLLADEQRDLATFLTPLQRAEFLAMQERAFRAAQQLRQQRAARAADARAPR